MPTHPATYTPSPHMCPLPPQTHRTPPARAAGGFSPHRAGGAGRCLPPFPAPPLGPTEAFFLQWLPNSPPRAPWELPSQTLFPKPASNLTHFSFKTRKHQQTRQRETDGNNYRRERAEPLPQRGQPNMSPRRLVPGHCCVTWAQAPRPPALPLGSRASTGRAQGLQAQRLGPRTWQLPALQGGHRGQPLPGNLAAVRGPRAGVSSCGRWWEPGCPVQRQDLTLTSGVSWGS